MAESYNRVGYSYYSIILILALGAFLLLFHLDHRPFWQDEAETAGLARNVLKYGVPRAYDGLNIISQEQGREYDQNYLWRWSPWLQIYLAAGAFRLGGLTTWGGRFPFAVLGLGCIVLVYYVVRHNFGNSTWAWLAAALLTASVPFLLYARQCRYYSLGAFLTLTTLYAFREDWQSKLIPALLLCLSTGMLFYTNYLLFFSFALPTLLAAIWIYPQELPLKKTTLIILVTLVITMPGLFLFRIQEQSQIVNIIIIPTNLLKYFGGLCQYMLPLPIALYLLWKWRRVFWTRTAIPEDPGERFTLFLSLVIVGNILLLSVVPQCEHRYLIHLYPLCAIILGWVILQTWGYFKIAGFLLAVLLLFTNWLHLLPMEWCHIIDRPTLNDRHMLTYPNFPLKLFVTEIISGYPDVNRNLIRFFQTEARPGDLILTTYGDLPLQFYTPYQVVGGLQGYIAPCRLPDWVVSRWDIRWNRAYRLHESEKFIKERLPLAADYHAITLPFEDETFGNNPDPYWHRFIPAAEPLARMVIYQKRQPRTYVP